MSSAATGRLSSVRLSATPLFLPALRARLGVWGRGGTTRRGDGHFLCDVLAQGGLVVFHRQQIVRAVFEDQLPRGLILGVQRVQGHGAAGQVQFAKEFAGHGDLVGLGVHPRAAQVNWLGTLTAVRRDSPGPWRGCLPSTAISSSGGGAPRIWV